ncbi:UbiA prenyltransferase family-domain-containing protein [Mycena sp. CBHHK59/15]|nr:UbiA prenyltransferase family-domain-containing protein [Mycena sp. CBHHK59/15]
MSVDFATSVFLFSQSDIIPILGPSLAVSMVLAGPTDIIAFIQGFVWLELHLLTFEARDPPFFDIRLRALYPDKESGRLSIYIVGLEEDRLAKPNRPIVCGKISAGAAHRLYLVVGALSLAYSVYHGVTLCSAVYMLAIWCYNEGGMSRHWFLKSFLGSIGYVCYCWGTTILLDHGNALSETSITAIAVSGLLHTTTGHAQDFRDRVGDASVGRLTLPLLLPPWLARWSLTALLAAWTAALARLWAPPLAAALVLAALGGIAAAKFVLDHSVESDRNSYWWYNMWLITAHLLPVFRRLAAGDL